MHVFYKHMKIRDQARSVV